MAYMSKDKNFMDDYNQGKDIYMELAKQYRPDLDFDTLKKRYRGKCKTLVLAIHYGMAINTLSHNLDMTMEETENLVNSYYSRYSSAKKYIDAAKKYCKENGEIKTVFGDKLYADARDYATAGINYVLQNSASVLMQFGFNNMDYAIRQVGIELHPKSVIHDSNQNEIWIEDLFYVDMAYKRFFRQYIREVFGVDFKYDLELLRTFRDHTVYSMDYETGIMTLDGSLNDCKYFEKYLTNKWNMTLIDEGEMKPAPEDLYLEYSRSLDNSKRGHQYCMHPLVRRDCPIAYGRKWKVEHDWGSDPIVQKIKAMPFDVTYVKDIFMNDHNLSYN